MIPATGWFTLRVRDEMRATHAEPRARPALWHNLIVFAALFCLVVLLQQASGAYHSEFGGYPDEPAHYATSVMVRDYLLSGKLSEPLAFATDYYHHYPKIAFGHWPPLLYAVQGTWMLVFSESRASLFVELALTTALAGLLLFLATRRSFGIAAGILASIVLVCLPVIQASSDEEMAESLLLVTAFASVLFFARYLERFRWQDSFWFGIFCSLTILTKGNGWALALVPPIALAVLRDFRVLARPSFWIPVPLVAVLCLPWQIMTLEMAHKGWTGGSEPNLKYTAEATLQFAWIAFEIAGSAIAVLAAWGIVVRVVAPFRRRSVQPLDAALFGLLISVWLFHSIVPAGVEERKLINALPAILLFAVAGGESVARFIAARLQSIPAVARWSRPLVAGVAVLLFAFQTFQIPKEKHYGFTEASQYLIARPDLNGSVILVSSERDGEGLLISEMMMFEKRPGHTVLRANKLLSSSDWNGNVSQEFCNTPEEVMQVLKRERVRAVVLDTYPSRVRYRHNDLIWKAIRDYPANWRLASTFGGGKIRVYDVGPA